MYPFLFFFCPVPGGRTGVESVTKAVLVAKLYHSSGHVARHAREIRKKSDSRLPRISRGVAEQWECRTPWYVLLTGSLTIR